MKKIDYTPIIVGSAMPFKSGTWEHLQSAYQEPLIDIIQMFQAKNDTEGFPNFTTPVIMYGCRWTGLGVSQGVVVYGTEIFRADAVNITLGFGQVVIGTITTTYFTAANADPVIFSDSTSNNVHEIRKIVWSAGASGSGDFDFDDCQMFGEWVDVVYNSSYLSADFGTLTLPGGAADFLVKWRQQGRTVIIDFNIGPMTLATATANYIQLSMPFNSNFKSEFHAVCYCENDTSVPVTSSGRVVAVATTTDIRVYPINANWALGTNKVITGQITVELDKF